MRAVTKVKNVSNGVETLRDSKIVHLTAYDLTALNLMIELKRQNIQFIYFKMDKWNHVFISTNK